MAKKDKNKEMNISWEIYFLCSVFLKWSLSNLIDLIRKKSKPIHIMFCTVDHYEPGTCNVTLDIERERVQTLVSGYPKLVQNHKDSAGNFPKRTWFFPPHYHRNNSLRELVSLCEKGYGEIELQLHHGKIRPDTSENLRKTILQCLKEYSYFGIFGNENGEMRYGFIHGDWALDNSRNGNFCGVNDEIQILRNTGCYADFTFPCLNEATPIQINSIYYAQDKPNKPKSYNTGFPVETLGENRGDLMIVQGPLYPFFRERKIMPLGIFGDAINGKPPVNCRRIDLWIKTGIHVKGRRDWIFVKTHTHGVTDSSAVLGKEMDDIWAYLETKYNDGANYVLHYVTARELYNIVKALEAGESAMNPEQYRNYKIQPPKYDSSQRISEASEKLKDLISKTYR